MSQSSLNIANITRSLFRAAVNNALQSSATGNSGPSAPLETYPFMIWNDTSANQKKQRNAADNAWIYKGELGQDTDGLLAKSGGSMTGPVNAKRTTISTTATTTAIWDIANGNVQDWTGVVTITAFPDAPQPGATRTCYPEAGLIITNNASISMQGNASYTVLAGDQLTIEALTTSTFKVWVNKKDGSSIASSLAGLFYKTNSAAPAFIKISAGAISIKGGTKVDAAGLQLTFAVDTAITMPTLTAGTDYAIYACTDGTIRADASFTFPTGYTALNSRKIGGFHYAPGSNAAARAGGDTTPAINEYSIWDLKFKPASPDPRGQMLVSGGFWADIYPLGVDHIINGTSKFNVTIADGSSPPKVPTQFGGNGTATYTTLTWWESAEVLAAYGKRLPTYAEFAALAFGTTEATSGGTDPVSTILRAAFTSKWGAILATGNMWFWGANFGGGAAGAGWTANTTGRGSTYQMENAAIFGGNWDATSSSGSRASVWLNSPAVSNTIIGARGVCDHVVLE
jgi:hypothetical protein